MQTQDKNTNSAQAAGNRDEGVYYDSTKKQPSITEDANDDPVLDEEDLEENNITDEEADNIEWDAPTENASQPRSPEDE